MNRRRWIVIFVSLLAPAGGFAQEDPGRARIGALTVTVYHATNGDPEAAGKRAKSITGELAARLSSEERLRFKHYSRLGEETQPLFRSYENWSQPLKPSDEILVRFEAQGKPTKQAAMLDLELWLARKKIVKSVARLEGDRPLFVLGPEWRGGRLIIAVALAPETKRE
jgi:hypothetical protein